MDKSVLSTNHYKSCSRALGINLYQFHCLQSPFTAAHSPWASRQQPETSRKTPLNHPWTTPEPPVNHPGTTREPPVNHPWITRETSMLEIDTKNWIRDPKNWFCTVSGPWNTRQTPVKRPRNTHTETPIQHPWNTHKVSVKYPWIIRGRSINIY